MKRIYIAGPMTGKEDMNRAEFEKAHKHLENLYRYVGCRIVNPIEKAKLWGWTEETLLPSIADILLGYLVDCDAIYMLRGWQDSKGATAEHAVAKWIGLEIIYQGESE